jgi:hypothetical protein
VKFLSVVKFYANSQEFETQINLLEAALRANTKIAEGAYGIIDLPSPYGNGDVPTLVFVANQNIKTADLEQINRKVASTVGFAGKLKSLIDS